LARLWYPQDALDAGFEAIKVVHTGATLRQEISGIENIKKLSSVDLDDVWNNIPDSRKQDSEYQIFYLVVIPMFAEALSVSWSRGEIEERLSEWERAFLSRASELVDPQQWLSILDFIKRVLISCANGSFNIEDTNLPQSNEDTTLRVFQSLAHSMKDGGKLVDNLWQQVTAVDFLFRSRNVIPEEHVMPGIGKVLHQYWLGVSQTRRFALNSPDLFHQELLSISPKLGVNTVIRVLLAARSAVGVEFGQEILTRMQERLS
jgi:hypothetical protein